MTDVATADPLLAALRSLTGDPAADFRDGQREAIEALCVRRERVLVVQRTGWGKSAVYFVATSILRGQGLGPTLLVSPLLALMRNQILAASRLGLRCMTVNSSTDTTVAELAERLAADDVDLVLVSPERLANPEFAAAVMPVLGERPGLVVIDEVHCISDWGHDFRPDYRRIGRLVATFGSGVVPVLGCTATANDRVVHDVAEQLGATLTTFRGPLGRDGLALGVLQLPGQTERLAWLVQHVPQMPGSGIVYCLTVRDTEVVADWLRANDIDAASYSGATPADERERLEERLLANELKVLVATTALGMGYDKPDLGFVIHFQMPGSPVGYYQQVGRAGRALDTSNAVLLCGREDADILLWFIDTAFPKPDDVDAVLAAFDRTGGTLSLQKLTEMVDVRRGQLELMLKQLDVEGVLRRVGGQTFERTDQPWTYPTERVAGVTGARRNEQQLMFDYVATDRCRMQFLTAQLDDPAVEPCGVCDNCTGRPVPSDIDPALVTAADAYVRRRPLHIEPKKQGIKAGERHEVGRVLCRWGDAGWAPLVEQGAADGVFADELLGAVFQLLAEWRPDPDPEWVASVPSTRGGVGGDPVADFAARLAEEIGLPYLDVVERIRQRPPQSSLQNSYHQKENVQGAFAVIDAPPDTPGLLVDDLYDSGWTLTEVATILRRAGAGPVHPVCLASTTGRST